MKGGAAGGGLSQVEPSQKINLHFHGDFHAITSAHNLLAAMIDSHLFHGNALDLDPAQITWPRTMDMNDRALRRITVGVGGKGRRRQSRDRFRHHRRVGDHGHHGAGRRAAPICAHRLGAHRRRAHRVPASPVTAADLGATGAMMALLDEAIMPNLVQTTEGTPALVHTGPFGNIAHGTSSILSQQDGRASRRLRRQRMRIRRRSRRRESISTSSCARPASRPAAAVLVTSVQSLRAQGEGELEAGFANLEHHIRTLRRFGVPIVVAINRFPERTPPKNLRSIATECSLQGVPCALVEAFTKGGAGAVDLAQKVVG